MSMSMVRFGNFVADLSRLESAELYPSVGGGGGPLVRLRFYGRAAPIELDGAAASACIATLATIVPTAAEAATKAGLCERFAAELAKADGAPAAAAAPEGSGDDAP